MINTAPGAAVTVITYAPRFDLFGFDDYAGARRGVLVETAGDLTRVMRLDVDGDFSGIIVEIATASIRTAEPGTIGDDHLVAVA